MPEQRDPRAGNAFVSIDNPPEPEQQKDLHIIFPLGNNLWKDDGSIALGLCSHAKIKHGILSRQTGVEATKHTINLGID